MGKYLRNIIKPIEDHNEIREHMKENMGYVSLSHTILREQTYIISSPSN